jgi:hypothetical protein
MPSFDFAKQPFLSSHETQVIQPTEQFLANLKLPSSASDVELMGKELSGLIQGVSEYERSRTFPEQTDGAATDIEGFTHSIGFLTATHDLRYSASLRFIGLVSGIEAARSHNVIAQKARLVGHKIVTKRAQSQAAGLCLATAILESTTASGEGLSGRSLYDVAAEAYENNPHLVRPSVGTKEEVGLQIMREGQAKRALLSPRKPPLRKRLPKLGRNPSSAIPTAVTLLDESERYLQQRDVPDFGAPARREITHISSRLNEYMLGASDGEPDIIADPRARLLGFLCETMT